VAASAYVPPTLPEGNNGIAAAYPLDSGITGNANVLLFDGFDTYTTISQLTSSGNWSNYYQSGNLLLDTSAGNFFGGTKAMRIRMPTSGGEVSNSIIKILSPTRDTLFMRAYVKYASNYSGMNSAHNGISMLANWTGPGVVPNGSNYFSVAVENSNYLSEPQPGYTNAYVYHPEQNDTYGEHWYPSGFTSNGDGPDGGFGSYFVARSNYSPTRGEWISYEIMVQANTPGVRDGRIAVWENGVIIADWQNIRFRDTSALKINEVRIENGGQSSTQINDKWYDNVVIATSYIGPMASGDSTAPIVQARSILSTGATFRLDLDEAVQAVSGAAGLTLSASGGALTLSGCTTATDLIDCTTSRQVLGAETVTATYSGSGGIQDLASNLLAAFTAQPVTNSSAQQIVALSNPLPAQGAELAKNIAQATIGVTTSKAATCRWGYVPGLAWGSLTQYSATGGTGHESVVSTWPGLVRRICSRCLDTAADQYSADSCYEFSVEPELKAPIR
jgi:hypothetical protein